MDHFSSFMLGASTTVLLLMKLPIYIGLFVKILAFTVWSCFSLQGILGIFNTPWCPKRNRIPYIMCPSAKLGVIYIGQLGLMKSCQIKSWSCSNMLSHMIQVQKSISLVTHFLAAICVCNWNVILPVVQMLCGPTPKRKSILNISLSDVTVCFLSIQVLPLGWHL